MTQRQSVSVVVPTFNHASFVCEAVRSILAQTHPPDEVVVVDDGSTDDTAVRLRAFGNAITVIHQDNRGLPEARNKGISASTGDLIAFCDADDVWLPTKLERQVPRFDVAPMVGVVHCGCTYVDVNLQRVRVSTVGFHGPAVSDQMLLTPTDVAHPNGSTAVVARKAIESTGQFDPHLPASEDWDLSYRLAKFFAVEFVNEPLVLYRLHDANMHKNVRLIERGMLLSFSKAFAIADPATQRLRRRAYARLHMMLAGAYFHAGEPLRCLRHAVLAIVLRPSEVTRAVGLPLRRSLRSLGRR